MGKGVYRLWSCWTGFQWWSPMGRSSSCPSCSEPCSQRSLRSERRLEAAAIAPRCSVHLHNFQNHHINLSLWCTCITHDRPTAYAGKSQYILCCEHELMPEPVYPWGGWIAHTFSACLFSEGFHCKGHRKAGKVVHAELTNYIQSGEEQKADRRELWGQWWRQAASWIACWGNSR